MYLDLFVYLRIKIKEYTLNKSKLRKVYFICTSYCLKIVWKTVVKNLSILAILVSISIFQYSLYARKRAREYILYCVIVLKHVSCIVQLPTNSAGR